MNGMLIPAVIFIVVTGLAGALMFLLGNVGSSATEDRLGVLTGKKKPDVEAQGIVKEDFGKASKSGIALIMSKLFKGVDNLSLFFEQADSPVSSERFYFLTACCIGVGGVLAWAAGLPVPLWPVLAIAGGGLPFMWMSFRRKRRFKQFAKQLPDAMELIARALRSGHSLNSGIHVVVEEMPHPIATEFMLAYEEQNLGVPIDRALKNMLRRMPNMDLKFFVTAVTIQKQAGGDLAEILDKIGYIIRERFKIMGQVMALTGEGRISGTALQALPIGLFLIVYSINPTYVNLLFERELGKQMLGCAIGLQFLGAYVIKRIVQIKI